MNRRRIEMLKKICVVVVMFLSFIVQAGYVTTGDICAAEKKESPNSSAEQNKTPERAVDPHVGYFRFYFQDEKMDYIFGSVILGATVNLSTPQARSRMATPPVGRQNGSRPRGWSRPGARNRWPVAIP
jgi:hypothetical protein